jgi:HD-like signal output (HDOD) protein
MRGGVTQKKDKESLAEIYESQTKLRKENERMNPFGLLKRLTILSLSSFYPHLFKIVGYILHSIDELHTFTHIHTTS